VVLAQRNGTAAGRSPGHGVRGAARPCGAVDRGIRTNVGGIAASFARGLSLPESAKVCTLICGGFTRLVIFVR